MAVPGSAQLGCWGQGGVWPGVPYRIQGARRGGGCRVGLRSGCLATGGWHSEKRKGEAGGGAAQTWIQVGALGGCGGPAAAAQRAKEVGCARGRVRPAAGSGRAAARGGARQRAAARGGPGRAPAPCTSWWRRAPLCGALAPVWSQGVEGWQGQCGGGGHSAWGGDRGTRPGELTPHALMTKYSKGRGARASAAAGWTRAPRARRRRAARGQGRAAGRRPRPPFPQGLSLARTRGSGWGGAARARRAAPGAAPLASTRPAVQQPGGVG
jgi:hypothetical protein